MRLTERAYPRGPSYASPYSTNLTCKWCGSMNCDGRCVDEIAAVVALYAEVVDISVERLPWMGRGACVGADSPDRFFVHPKAGVPESVRRMCALCPVMWECRDYGTAHDEEGVWGGLTREERRDAALRDGEPPLLSPPAHSRVRLAAAATRRKVR